MRSRPWCHLQSKRLIETTADDFIEVLWAGGAMIHATLRCLQNLAVGMGWLPWPVLPNKLWPARRAKKKRGVTWEEHQRIVQAEQNPERRLYYQLLWATGASQSDAALLRAENVDWPTRVLIYQRQKTGEMAHLRIGGQLESLLRQLPSRGLLFPKLARALNSARSSEFCRRCRLLGIRGVSLHSYRVCLGRTGQVVRLPSAVGAGCLGPQFPGRSSGLCPARHRGLSAFGRVRAIIQGEGCPAGIAARGSTRAAAGSEVGRPEDVGWEKRGSPGAAIAGLAWPSV